MGRRKRRNKRFNRKDAVTFHLVHRSQRDPLAANADVPQMVLVPDGRTAKKLADVAREADGGRSSRVATRDDFADAVFTPSDFAALKGGAGEGAGGGYEYEYEYYSDGEDDGGDGGKGKAEVEGEAGASGEKQLEGDSLVPRDAEGRVLVAAINPDLDADVDGSVVDNYAYSAYFGHTRAGDMYDYSQHLRPFASDGTFVGAPGMFGPPIADVTVFKPAVEITPSTLDEATGLPAEVLASKFEEDVGLLNLAAPVPEGFRTDLPLDVLQALEDEDEFEELQDDFIQIAQAEQPVNDADGFDDTEWALEYARVMEPEKYERIMQSRSEMGFNSVFGGGSDESGVAYTEASSTFVSMVPVHGTPYSVASTVNRPRAGLHEIDDERLEVMMEKDYEIDQIGELPFSRDTRGNMSVADFEAIIEDVLAGKVLRKHFKREVLLEPVRDMPDLRQRILAAAARQAEVDGTTPQPQPGDELDAAMGFKPRAKMPEHDVESILSLNSNVSNHPRKIQSHSGRSTIKSSATTTPTIPARNTAPKGSRADADAGPAPGSGTSADAAADDDEYEYVYDDGSVNVVNEGMKRPANETKAEKRARKKAIKEARRAARQRKKANRAAFKSEAKVLKKQTMPHDGVRPGDSIIRY
ncbi:uncharacterized protein AMSG_00620 [Thecamonas trahens ATCC 50062]|uniref:Low temperature viability protein n=1 Tax=Thecamonas trahens ATCC 50062 TaxID=461836 RepID=A0A0L0DDS7_THETB|nr:hypothetical protein AMSG_00620 [Thecamonas trahens ATCC 50062]KNC50459.1 hypothetical protein AMSG_00620 [Thecamonas trahens ATCC 50062]|eukprot:XP_013762355.1 hypothetical protein AMSG_00620 [Thecamonas trahens ATCC 50062]